MKFVCTHSDRCVSACTALKIIAGSEKCSFRHRKVRHHEAGIAQVCKLFGQDAGKAVKQHIVSDLKTEGWTADDPFPKNEDDYVMIGFF